MPNWCENRLQIVGGPREKILELIRKASGETPFDFENLRPTPPELLEDGNDGWYEWRVRNWGTKWNSTDFNFGTEEYTDNESALLEQFTTGMVYFMTAWSPPIELLSYVAAQYPELSFTLYFYESGMCFAGMYRWEGGSLVDAHDYEIGSEGYTNIAEDIFGYGEDFLEETT